MVTTSPLSTLLDFDPPNKRCNPVWCTALRPVGRDVVEGCVSWLKQNSVLGIRYKELTIHYLAMLKLALVSRYLGLLVSRV